MADVPLQILNIQPLSEAGRAKIEAVDPHVRLTDAQGWFAGEYLETWPEKTTRRYLRSSSQGKGTRQERDALLARAEVILGGWPYPLDLRARSPKLKWFHQTPAGASNLQRGDIWGSDILVTTSRGHGNTLPIAEYAIAGLLHFAKNLDQAERDRAAGGFDGDAYRALGIAGKRLCIIGAGGIGREIARLAAALGMDVVGTRRHAGGPADAAPFAEIGPPQALAGYLETSDFIAVACQLTPETEGLLDSDAFARMKPGAILVNVARGEIVDEDALLAALGAGTLRGAVLDVYTGEFEGPPRADLWSHPKVLITPHSSSGSDTFRNTAIDFFCANLRRYLDGQPLEQVIDWERGY